MINTEAYSGILTLSLFGTELQFNYYYTLSTEGGCLSVMLFLCQMELEKHRLSSGLLERGGDTGSGTCRERVSFEKGTVARYY